MKIFLFALALLAISIDGCHMRRAHADALMVCSAATQTQFISAGVPIPMPIPSGTPVTYQLLRGSCQAATVSAPTLWTLDKPTTVIGTITVPASGGAQCQIKVPYIAGCHSYLWIGTADGQAIIPYSPVEILMPAQPKAPVLK